MHGHPVLLKVLTTFNCQKHLLEVLTGSSIRQGKKILKLGCSSIVAFLVNNHGHMYPTVPVPFFLLWSTETVTMRYSFAVAILRWLL